jgi:hypothetical protein
MQSATKEFNVDKNKTTTDNIESPIKDLSDAQLALIGGGCGEVVFG